MNTALCEHLVKPRTNHIRALLRDSGVVHSNTCYTQPSVRCCRSPQQTSGFAELGDPGPANSCRTHLPTGYIVPVLCQVRLILYPGVALTRFCWVARLITRNGTSDSGVKNPPRLLFFSPAASKRLGYSRKLLEARWVGSFVTQR